MKQKVSVAERARARAWWPKLLGDLKKSLCLFGPLYGVERKGELAGHSHSSSTGACYQSLQSSSQLHCTTHKDTGLVEDSLRNMLAPVISNHSKRIDPLQFFKQD